MAPSIEPDRLTTAREEGALERWQSLTRWPVTALSVLFVGVFFAPVVDQPWAARNAVLLEAVGTVVWVVVIVDYVVGLALARRRRRYVATHVPELLAVAVPALRPLVPVFVLVRRSELLSTRGRLAERALIYVAVLSVAVIVLAAGAVVLAERQSPDRTITTFEEGLWWSVVTVTTVGYGDFYPVTAEGRLLAVLHMAVGIALVGTITAAVASWFVERAQGEDVVTQADVAALVDEVRSLRREVAALRDGTGVPTPSGEARPDTGGPPRAWEPS